MTSVLLLNTYLTILTVCYNHLLSGCFSGYQDAVGACIRFLMNDPDVHKHDDDHSAVSLIGCYVTSCLSTKQPITRGVEFILTDSFLKYTRADQLANTTQFVHFYFLLK